MQNDSHQQQFYWALTPEGWVPCDGFDTRPGNAVVVSRIQPWGIGDVESGVRPTNFQEARLIQDADKEALVGCFGPAPQYPIPRESLIRITEKVTRLLGLRTKRPAAWDELRNALIEARYLRGILSAPGKGGVDAENGPPEPTR